MEIWRFLRVIYKEIVLPESLRVIGDYAFLSCEFLEEVVIPEGVVSIGDEAFFACTALQQVELASTITAIGMRAFENCGAEVIQIPKSVTDVGSFAFVRTPWIYTQWQESPFVVVNGILVDVNQSLAGNIEIPTTVKVIGDIAFCYCDDIVDVHIPETVTCIEDYAFVNCSSLKNVYIPDSVIEMEEDIFVNAEFGGYTGPSSSCPTYDFYYMDGLVIHAKTGSVGQQYIYKGVDLDDAPEGLFNAKGVPYSYVPTNEEGDYSAYIIDSVEHEILSEHIQEVIILNKTYPVEIRCSNNVTISIPIEKIDNITDYRYNNYFMTNMTLVDSDDLEMSEEEFIASLQWLGRQLPEGATIRVPLGEKWAGEIIYCYAWGNYAGILLADNSGAITLTDHLLADCIFSTKGPELIKNDTTGIPDKNLYDAILEAADTNGDGFLEKSEAEELDYFFAEDKNIVSLEGI